MKEQLLEVGTQALRQGEGLGIDKIEVYLESIRAIEASVEGSKLQSVAMKVDCGCGIRVVHEKRIGYAYATAIDPDIITQTIQQALSLSKISSRDDAFVNLPSQADSYPSVRGLFDSSIAKLTPEEATDFLMRAVQSNHDYLKDFSPLNIGILHSKDITRVIMNSNDLSCSSRSTSISMFLDATIRKDGEQGNSWDESLATRLSGIDPEQIGISVAEQVTHTIGTKEIEGGTLPVVLSPYAVSHLFGNRRRGSVGCVLNHLDVQKNNSYLIDMIGSQIGSESLTLVDDAILEGGVFSRPFDAEGAPSMKTVLIQDGILQNYLHNSYSANKSGLNNTGNAYRESYTESPRVAASNLVLSAGRVSDEEMLSQIKRGIYCRFTGDLPDPLSGDVNAIVMQGYLIENGVISHPVGNTMFSINMLDLMKNISCIGNRLTITENGLFPSLLIDNVRVSSG